MLVMLPSVPGCAAEPSPADCMLAHPATTSRTSGVQKFTVFRIARLRLTVESEGGQGNSQLFARWPTLRAAEDSASSLGSIRITATTSAAPASSRLSSSTRPPPRPPTTPSYPPAVAGARRWLCGGTSRDRRSPPPHKPRSASSFSSPSVPLFPQAQCTRHD